MLLERKGIFPYDFVDSWAKLNNTELPQKADFFSKLTDTHISDADWKFADQIWKTFDITTMGNYADLYLKVDVLLLADVFENFRMKCMEIYGLDPAHSYTLPGFAWNAMMKQTKVEMELMTSIDMVLFVERGIRGGITQCCKRYARANNVYMGEVYDNTKPESYLIYLDVNSLYATAMMQELPLNNFEWLYNVTTLDDINRVISNHTIGCLIEVDLKYPTHLHDKHIDYPLCPEKMIPQGGRNEKLLQFVCSQGLIIEKIHRVLKFQQSAWLKPFIELNTYHRTIASNAFEKNLFKLMSNAVFIFIFCNFIGKSGEHNLLDFFFVLFVY